MSVCSQRQMAEKMDDLKENRMKTKEEFLEHLSLGFRGLRKALLSRLEGKSIKSVFLAIGEIISGEKLFETVPSDFPDNGYESLMRRLTANNSEELKDSIYNSMQLSIGNLLRQMVAETKTIKESDKKIEKLLRKYSQKVGTKSKSKSAIVENLKEQWQAYERTIFRQKILLACLDEKLNELKHKIGQKLTRLLFKYIVKTRKLVRRFRDESGINSSDSDSSGSGDETQEQKDPPKDVKKASQEVSNKTKRLLRKIVTPGFYKIAPWPVGDPEGPGIQPDRQVDYGMFTAPTGLAQASPSVETTLNQTSSVTTLNGPVGGSKIILVSQAPSALSIHSITSDEGDHQVAGTAPPTPEREISQEVHLAKMTNVYTKVVKAYTPKDKTELKLKVGQVIKQKRPADESGMAYGWTKTSKVGLKKYGFFPVSHVALKGGK